MDEPQPSFFEFLRAMNLRVFQDREVGLDVYLSGFSAIAPAVLAIVSATVFLLAIFQLAPSRKHIVSILLVLGALAFGVGAAGAHGNYSAHVKPAAKPQRVVTDGRGGDPGSKPGQVEALLSLPLVVGSSALAANLAGVLFLAIFGGGGGYIEAKRREKHEKQAKR